MAATYTAGDAKTKAKDALRLLVGDTATSKPLLQDEEIDAILGFQGLELTSAPADHMRALLRAASKACEAIAAKLSQKSEIVIQQFGAVKATAAREYRDRARELARQAATPSTIHFFNPSTYETTHVAGVDADPAEE